MVLETAKERVRLLEIGMKGKQIEQLYVQRNGFSFVPATTTAILEVRYHDEVEAVRIDWNALETAWAKQYEADYIKGEVDATV